VGLPVGSKCGGTCNVHGHCAIGLSCLQSGDPPKILLLGTTPPGVCTFDRSTLKEPSTEPQGCCFSIGYGNRMRPCCLQSKKMNSPEVCNVGQRLGGTTAFHAGMCPASADEAANLIQHTAASQLQSVADAQGCCYAIGYGAMMKPCCLQTELVSNISMCRMSQRLGGAASYSARGCPISAAQAAGWLGSERAQEVALGEHSNSNNRSQAIIIGFVLAVVSGILLTGVLIFARQRFTQDSACSFQAYESPNEEEEETRTPLQPTK